MRPAPNGSVDFLMTRLSGEFSHSLSAAANRRLAGQLIGSDNLSAIVAADRATWNVVNMFPAAVAESCR